MPEAVKIPPFNSGNLDLNVQLDQQKRILLQNTIRTLRQFGAHGDGITNDTVAINLAITYSSKNKRIVSGDGLTYAVSGNITLKANTWIENATFKQLAPDAAGDVRTLTSASVNNITLIRVGVDRNGDGTNGGIDDDAGFWINGGSGHHFESCFVFGDDIGVGMRILNASDFIMLNCFARDLNYLLVADPGNERVKGIQMQACVDFKMVGCEARDLGGDYGSGQTTEHSKGLSFTGCEDFIINGCRASDVDQGIVYSGDVNNGNKNFAMSGCQVKACYSHGFKFANSASQAAISACVANDCGLNGFSISGGSLSGSIITRDLLFTGCYAINTGSNGIWTTPVGFEIAQGSVDSARPYGIKFLGCRAIDDQSVPTMKYGFFNRVHAQNEKLNEFILCESIGHTVSAFDETHSTVTRGTLDNALTTTTATWTDVDWELEDPASANMIDTVGSNPERIIARKTGEYRVSFVGEYTAHATGNRRCKLQKNGVDIARTDFVYIPHATIDSTIHTEVLIELVAGDYIIAQVRQDSGGNLDLTTNTAIHMHLVGHGHGTGL